MSKQGVDNFFQQYVFGFMFSDIRREIDLAASGRNGGNLLATLGLLCYTEVLGNIKHQNFSPLVKKVSNKDKFAAFFDILGPGYLGLWQYNQCLQRIPLWRGARISGETELHDRYAKV